MRICVVDDESSVRKSIVFKLNSLQLPIQVFNSGFGEQALQEIEKVKPDIVLLDIHMPKIDGLSMFERIKKIHSPARVVILSGYSKFEYAQAALKLGADDYLLKPVDRKELRNVIGKIDEQLRQDFQKELDYYVQQLENQGVTLKDIEVLNYYAWQDTAVRKKFIFAYTSKGREYDESTFLIKYRFNHCIEGAIITDGRGKEMTVVSLQEWATAFIQVFEKWESSIFFGRNELNYRNRLQPDETQMSEIQQAGSRLLQSFRKSADFETNQLFSSWFEWMGQLPLSEIRKACAGLLLQLDEHIWSLREFPTHKSTDLQLEKRKKKRLRDWENWVRMHKSWGYLEMDMQKIFSHKLSIKETLERKHKQLQNLSEQVMHELPYIPYKDVSLEVLAAKLHVHPVTLSRKFKEQTGKSFLQVLTQIKMEQARKWFIETEQPIQQIAEDLGYLDTNYFSQLFKKYYGKSPSQYRKEHKE